MAEEEVEGLKTWWKENGRFVVSAAVLGLGSVVGWNVWQDHRQGRAEQASQRYDELAEAAVHGRHDDVLARSDFLIEHFPGSGYAILAALIGATSAVAQERFQEAATRLEWVVQHASRDTYRDLARIRLARVRIDEGAWDAALAVLEAMESAGFAATAGELRGDVHLARGEREEARAAYRGVLSGEAVLPASLVRVRMKLDDLGQLNVP